MGQTKTVVVYKARVMNSAEERITGLQVGKLMQAAKVLLLYFFLYFCVVNNYYYKFTGDVSLAGYKRETPSQEEVFYFYTQLRFFEYMGWSKQPTNWVSSDNASSTSPTTTTTTTATSTTSTFSSNLMLDNVDYLTLDIIHIG